MAQQDASAASFFFSWPGRQCKCEPSFLLLPVMRFYVLVIATDLKCDVLFWVFFPQEVSQLGSYIQLRTIVAMQTDCFL